MALDEGMGMVAPRRPRRRMAGPPDPIAEALAQRDRPQGRPDAGRFPEFASEKFHTFDDSDVGTPHRFAEHMGEGDDFARQTGEPNPYEEEPEENPIAALLAMLQGDEQQGEEEEYRPVDEEGDPWGMDTDPGDATVLRNLLAVRRQGLQQGRYR